MNKLFAVVGMSGSGKSVVTDYLEQKNFNKVYFGGVVIEELTKATLEITPENEKYMREKLREDHGMAAMAILSLPKIKRLLVEGDVIIDGLYSWEEYLVLKETYPNIQLISIVVDKKLRHERVAIRPLRPLNNEEIKTRDTSEIEKLNKGGPISIADFYLLNNGTFNDLYKQIDKILTKGVDENA